MYNSIILCDYYYFFIVNNFSMFNIVSIIIFGLIVFFMNTSLPFLYFFYIFFNVLLWIYLLRITLSFLIIFSQYTNVLFQKNYSSFRVLLVSKPKRQLHFIVIDSNIFILIVWCLCEWVWSHFWWAQMDSASRVLKTIHPNCFCFALLSTSFSIPFMFYLIKNINVI